MWEEKVHWITLLVSLTLIHWSNLARRYYYPPFEQLEPGLFFFIDKAQELTVKGKGKHHIGDFLPADELKKFTAKVKAVKGESSLDNFDFSDYAEHKIKEDNIGYKMLQQAGWKEGMGLGSQGQGITAPVNKYVNNSGIQPLRSPCQQCLSFVCSILMHSRKTLHESSKIFVMHVSHVVRIQFGTRPGLIAVCLVEQAEL